MSHNSGTCSRVKKVAIQLPIPDFENSALLCVTLELCVNSLNSVEQPILFCPVCHLLHQHALNNMPANA